MPCRSMTWLGEAPPTFTLAKGELPDLRPYPVRLVEADGSISIRPFTSRQITGLKPYQPGAQTGFLSVPALEGGTLSLSIPVVYTDVKLTRLTLTACGRQAYRPGDLFDPDGYVLEARYSDGSQKTVSSPLCPEPVIREGQTEIALSYGCRTCSVPLQVTSRRITALRLARPPRKQVYHTGFSQVDLTDGVLEVTWDDGTLSQIPMEGMAAAARSNQAGETQVDVIHEGRTVSFPIHVEDTAIAAVQVLSMPRKTAYHEGESLDLTGLVLQITYPDGTTEQLRSLCTDRTLRLGEESVTLNCLGIFFTVPVQVTRPHPVSLSVSTLPERREYQVGEEMDLTGGTLTVQMSDGRTTTMPLSQARLSGFHSGTPGPVEVTVQAMDLETTFQVEILPRLLTALEIQGTPRKTYTEGEPYTTDGMQVLGVYSNGDRELVTEYELDRSIACVQDTFLEISCGDLSTRIPVQVQPRKPVSIRMKTLPRCEYTQGEAPPSWEDGVVELTYPGGETRDIPLQSADLSGCNLETPGTQTITVTAEGLTTTFSITVQPAGPQGIRITKPPRTRYQVGESFSREGMEVCAVYGDGHMEDITAEAAVPLNRPLLDTDTTVMVLWKEFAAVIALEITPTAPEPRFLPALAPSQESTSDPTDPPPPVVLEPQHPSSGNGPAWAFVPWYPSTAELRFQEETP